MDRVLSAFIGQNGEPTPELVTAIKAQTPSMNDTVAQLYSRLCLRDATSGPFDTFFTVFNNSLVYFGVGWPVVKVQEGESDGVARVVVEKVAKRSTNETTFENSFAILSIISEVSAFDVSFNPVEMLRGIVPEESVRAVVDRAKALTSAVAPLTKDQSIAVMEFVQCNTKFNSNNDKWTSQDTSLSSLLSSLNTTQSATIMTFLDFALDTITPYLMKKNGSPSDVLVSVIHQHLLREGVCIAEKSCDTRNMPFVPPTQVPQDTQQHASLTQALLETAEGVENNNFSDDEDEEDGWVGPHTMNLAIA
jgi:hypothetical protein